MSETVRRVWLELTADRRKFGVLCTASAVGLLLWARLIVVSQMPRMAIADDPAPEGREVGALPAGAPVPPAHIRLDDRPRHDPFAVSDAHFPRPEPGIDIDGNRGKSRTEPVEIDSAVSVSQRERLEAAIGSLALDGVMPDASLAIIDGELRKVGDVVRVGTGSKFEFLLTEVRQRSVVLAHDDFRIELKMRGPLG